MSNLLREIVYVIVIYEKPIKSARVYVYDYFVYNFCYISFIAI